MCWPASSRHLLNVENRVRDVADPDHESLVEESPHGLVFQETFALRQRQVRNRLHARCFASARGARAVVVSEVDHQLLDQVLVKFYWLREQSELRKKPSTSELVDWISALLRAGITEAQISESIPFLGALLKNEQDTEALVRYKEEGGAFPKDWKELGPKYNQ